MLGNACLSLGFSLAWPFPPMAMESESLALGFLFLKPLMSLWQSHCALGLEEEKDFRGETRLYNEERSVLCGSATFL